MPRCRRPAHHGHTAGKSADATWRTTAPRLTSRVRGQPAAPACGLWLCWFGGWSACILVVHPVQLLQAVLRRLHTARPCAGLGPGWAGTRVPTPTYLASRCCGICSTTAKQVSSGGAALLGCWSTHVESLVVRDALHLSARCACTICWDGIGAGQPSARDDEQHDSQS